jgi:hypothetical protein
MAARRSSTTFARSGSTSVVRQRPVGAGSRDKTKATLLNSLRSFPPCAQVDRRRWIRRLQRT